MSTTNKHQEEVIGQDSFLDVVANLVGILIILVMGVGARATTDMDVASTELQEPPAAAVELQADVVAAKSAADDVEKDFRRIMGQMKAQEIEIVYRKGERDKTQLVVAAAEQSIDKQRQQLDDSQRQAFDRQKAVSATESELDELNRAIGQIDSSLPQTEIISHLPTPMAKTVFGHEVHLRLHRGRVAYVPWDDFIARLKVDASQKAGRLREQPEYTDTIGPVGGFWMRYTLKKESHVLQGKVGVAVQQTVSLEKFELLAEDDEMGEPLEEALREDSQLAAVLAKNRPSSTTITVWTYPDSFSEFRRLKRVLFDRGYVTAARPLPPDHPIGGSPDGTRSAAQ
jgi:hypothetical protein